MQWMFEDSCSNTKDSNRYTLPSPFQFCDAGAVSDSQIQKLPWISQIDRLALTADSVCEGRLEAGELLVTAVESGALEYSCGSIAGGQAMIITSDQSPFTLTACTDCKYIALVLSGTLVQTVMAEKLRRGEVFFSNGLPDVQNAVFIRDAEELEPEEYSIAAYRLLMRLYKTAERYRETKGYPLLVQTAMGIMREEFAMIDGVPEVAERLEITPSYLNRLFSKYVGIPPGRYLKLCRVEYAKNLLGEPDMPVSLVSDLSGFSSSNYFAKVFRTETGMSPSEYAASHIRHYSDPTIRHKIDESVL